MSAARRTAGVLGGMGPAATIDFMTKVLAHSQRARGADSREQDDVRLIVDSNPMVPDRNAAVAGTGPSPAPLLAEMARGLAAAGADFLVMPCNAAHAFAPAIAAATSLPFVSMVQAVAGHVRQHWPDARSIAVLTAAGASDARLYETALDAVGLAATTPQGPDRERFMEALWAIKGGDRGERPARLIRGVAEALVSRGASLVVAGCSEVPLVLHADDVDVPLVDATDILAQRTVAIARGAPASA